MLRATGHARMVKHDTNDDDDVDRRCASQISSKCVSIERAGQ